MSSPFPVSDFLEGSWEPLAKLARTKRQGGGYDPFPALLPELKALDLDKIKDVVCAYRGWGLCSVDAVTLAEDGRILFIEFKVTEDDERAWLRKKGFDSLFLFWVAAGRTLTMEEIRSRAVFWYVTTTSGTGSADALSQARQMAGGHHPQRSLPDQAEHLSKQGLYRACCHYQPQEFSAEIQKANVAQSSEELRSRLTQQPTSNTRSLVPSARQKSDFEDDVSPIAGLRMIMPFDSTVHKDKPNEVLRVATRYDATTQTASFQHDWTQTYPAMALAARCFDTFMMWSLAFHADKKLADLGKLLNGRVSFSGDTPTAIRDGGGFFHRFWEVFHQPYADGHPLAPFVDQNFYAQLG